MSPGLLKAALSFSEGKEDRLTELFAAVLEVNLDCARVLFERAGLPFGDELEVRTQDIPESGCRLDLVLITTQHGRRVAELWSEHKTTSPFSAGQLEKYSRVLAATGRAGRVISVVATPAALPPEDPERERFLWQDIAEFANNAGYDWAGAGWREGAMKADAPARMRLLHEFIWYVTREGYAVVDALEEGDIAVFQGTPRTWPRIEALMEKAAGQMTSLAADGELDAFNDGSWCWQAFHPPGGSWPARLTELRWKVYPELTLAAEALWSPEHANEPAFGAGVAVDSRLTDELAGRDEWLDRATAAGFSTTPVDQMLTLYKTKPLAEVIASADTLGGQASMLAEWAERSITEALALDPGAVEPRPSRKS